MAGLLGVPGLDGYRAALQDNQARDMNTVGLMQGVLGLQNGILEQQMTPLKMEQLKIQLARQKQSQDLIKRLMGGGASQGGVLPSPTDALAQGAAQGDIGPTVTNAARMEQPQAQGMSQGGNGLELPPMIQAALLSGDPGLEKWAQAQAQQFKPTDKIREAIALGMTPGSPQFKAYVGTVYNQGGAWQANPQGGVNLAPGYADAMGQIRGNEASATSAAQAPYQIQEFEIGGRKYRMSVADYKTLTEPPKNDADAMRALQMAERLGIPYDSGWIRKNGAPNQTDGSVRVGAPSLPSLFGSATDSEKTYDSERAKDFAKEAQKFNEAYQAGTQQRDNLDLLDGLLKNGNVAAGSLAELNSDLKGVAASFGINIAGKTEEDVIRAITREMALKMKNQGGTNLMPGAMSDFEQKMLGSMVPGLSQSPQGRLLLSQVMRAKLERDMKISEMAADYEANNGRLDSKFYKQARDWMKANPTFTPEKQKAMLELATRLAK